VTLPSEKRLLTADEIAALETRTDLVSVQIDFGAALDTAKEYTVMEYAEFITKMSQKYKGTALEPILSAIAWSYGEKAKTAPRAMMLPPKVHHFSDCGGCGCQPEPLPACYVATIACFSC
jgi:hypothetical protein